MEGKRITEATCAAANGAMANERRRSRLCGPVLLRLHRWVPLLVDPRLCGPLSRLKKHGDIEPLVPVDLVIDHSVQVDFSSTKDAFEKNMTTEFKRNNSRYQFLKWGTQAFDGFAVIPPGIGICHQVNLEFLARSVWEKHDIYYPDTLVGTDSHTTMINGLGIVAWGVGGIEAEAAMLGQPVYFLTPDVVGVCLSGSLREGVTARPGVAVQRCCARPSSGKFVSFWGGRRQSWSDRATSEHGDGNRSEHGLLPSDEETCLY